MQRRAPVPRPTVTRPRVRPPTITAVRPPVVATVANRVGHQRLQPDLEVEPIELPDDELEKTVDSYPMDDAADPDEEVDELEYNQDLYTEIVPRDYQRDHIETLMEILGKQHGYIDTSIPGAGKTYVTGYIAQRYGWPMLIISSNTIINTVWKPFCAMHQLPVYDILSYQQARGSKDKQPKHPYLERVDDGKNVSFFATDTWIEIVNQGVLLVIDEIQHLKNNSAQHKACSAMIKTILDIGGVSRFALLSGSPYDQEKHVKNLLHMLGYIRSDKLYRRVNRTTYLEGINELIVSCRSIDPFMTHKTLVLCPPDSKENIVTLSHKLFVDVIKPCIVNAMPNPTNIVGRLDASSGFFDLGLQERMDITANVEALARALKYNDDNDEVEDVNTTAGQGYLRKIAVCKVPIFVRMARKWLEEDPTCKVVIFNRYHTPISRIATELKQYKPLVLTGKTKPANRLGIINTFEHSDDHRLILLTTAVGSEGISLHDTRGDRPRKVLMLPDFSILDLHQAAKRCYRDGTMSDVELYMVYAKAAAKERNIINALARKTGVLRDILDQQVRDGVLFPGEYPTYTEQ